MKKLAFILLFSLAASTVSAQTIDIYVDPASVSDSSLTPGSWVDIDVKVDVDYAPGLLAAVFSVEWDTNILSFWGATIGDFFQGNSYILWANEEWDPGYYYLYGTLVAGPNNPSVGTYTLVTLTFEVVGTGSTPITLGPGVAPANQGWTVPIFWAGAEVGASSVTDGSFANDGTGEGPPPDDGGDDDTGDRPAPPSKEEDDSGLCSASAAAPPSGAALLVLFGFFCLICLRRAARPTSSPADAA